VAKNRGEPIPWRSGDQPKKTDRHNNNLGVIRGRMGASVFAIESNKRNNEMTCGTKTPGTLLAGKKRESKGTRNGITITICRRGGESNGVQSGACSSIAEGGGGKKKCGLLALVRRVWRGGRGGSYIHLVLKKKGEGAHTSINPQNHGRSKKERGGRGGGSRGGFFCRE